MFKGILKRVIGDPSEKEIKRLQPIVDEINGLEAEFEKLSDEDLRAMTASFKAQIAEATAGLKAELEERRAEMIAEDDFVSRERLRLGVEKVEERIREVEEDLLSEFLPRAFAAVREASKRTLGMRHFDVQLIGGIVLHQGKIAEMKTGEGKTLAATLPLYLNALTGRGVHLVTPNDYLSKFGVQWMGPIYNLLGVSVGVIQSAAADPNRGSFLYDPNWQSDDDRFNYLRPCTRREAYLADVTYGTNNEFGFDYLRDNMVRDLSQCVQRELYYAIVDEVDNILIDEARTPLIISGQAEESSDLYRVFAEVVRGLRPSSKESIEAKEPDGDYEVDEKARIVTLTERGIEKVQRRLGIDDLYSSEHFDKTPYLDNALRAAVLYKRDKDYIVDGTGEVIIVDEFTGRLMHGRRYAEGLHQAIEAKEGVRVQRESLTLATITFQNYFRMYKKLAGMTGTAATEAEEFHKIYGLDVVVIPTHKPMIRIDHPDVVYKDERAKFRAVVEEVAELHRRGQPVLLGTASIENSEMLSEMLRRRKIPHSVLNAKQHEKEALIIAQAGRPGAVTIATNMAGRGVDILLGGNPEGLARDRLRREGVDLATVHQTDWNEALDMLRAGQDPTERYPDRWAQVLAEAWEECARNRERVLELGGLHILGTERHEARRIDNQLRGRAGRQGDPGSSRFYLSLEDELMRRFGGQSIAGLMERLGVEDDIPIEHGLVSKSIENAQIKVEGYNFDIRKHVLEYDDVVNKQREVIYAQRRQILSEPTLKPIILRMVHKELDDLVNTYTVGYRDEWDLAGLWQAVRAIMPLPPTLTSTSWESLSATEIADQLHGLAEQLYEAKEQHLGAETMRQVERLTMLHVVDNLWVRHLTDLDNLREGIGLRAVGQQDPLVAYQKEAHEMYNELMVSIQHDIVHRIYHAEVVRQPQHRVVREMRANVDSRQRRGVVRSVGSKVGRNDPCPCGSGKKYKYCHMRQDRAPVAAQQPAAHSQPVAQPRRSAKRRRRRKR